MGIHGREKHTIAGRMKPTYSAYIIYSCRARAENHGENGSLVGLAMTILVFYLSLTTISE
jgi:hypothetical protein